jgi:hypothetical protein
MVQKGFQAMGTDDIAERFVRDLLTGAEHLLDEEARGDPHRLYFSHSEILVIHRPLAEGPIGQGIAAIWLTFASRS